MLPRYDWHETYDWNYRHAPAPLESDVPPFAGDWHFCGRPVPSPLGIAAGPLLNGKWILYYASLGFDVLTYKTVRSRQWPCYELPNLQPVAVGTMLGGEQNLPTAADMQGTWAVSFGMPSQPPDVWRADVEQTCRTLPPEKILSVSVVATVEPDWSIDQVAEDYARCSGWAKDSGADTIEVNFSCPNVASRDGQLFQQAEASGLVAQRVREAIGPGTPLLIKIGHLTDAGQAEELVRAVDGSADALVMTNSISATVAGPDGPMFGGQRRGICGDAIRQASIEMVRMVQEAIQRSDSSLQIVGVGGISSAEHVRQFLAAGAHSVQLATSVMIQPDVGIEIRKSWAREGGEE